MLVISNNFDRPAVNLEKNHLKEILVLLHNNFTEEEIKKYFGLNDEKYNSAINDLYGEGLIKKNEKNIFIPACMVINAEEGKELKKSADSLGREMSLIAIDRIDKIKSAYKNIPSLKNIPFENMSLLILGNAVYNFWQMPLINEKFLKSDPPHRGAGRYYLAVLENKTGSRTEQYELYFNKILRAEKFTAVVYGNNLNVADSILEMLNKSELNADKNFILLNPADQKKISELSAVMEPDITAYLERNRTHFVKLYLNSSFKDEASFREWFAWFYQFMVSQTTRTLTEKNFIKKEMSRQAPFILIK